ncbi:septum formation initiator family protein [Candidatus Nomurabacteria bacterium]|nr:septum formation initiator family protein [Candidatus Nomurabacteria bacterium]
MFTLFGKMLETSKNKKIAEAKIAELKENKFKLDRDIDKLNTNQGLEENIREKFGLVKEGENMIVIVDEKKEVSVPLEANSGGFFSFFLNLFK